MKIKKKTNATVIPAPRKSVKRMMVEAMVRFLSRLCFCSEQDPPMYMDREITSGKTLFNISL